MTDPAAPPPTKKRRPDGFVERGDQVTRLEAFVDAAFAFAVTMLVIGIGLPDPAVSDAPTISDVMRGLGNVPAFLASFALIAMFWWAHQTWSRRYGLDDGKSLFLSLGLVFLVMVYIYPLRLMFLTAFAWLFHVALPDGWQVPMAMRIDSIGDLVSLFVIYGLAWTSLGLVIVLLYRHAWSQRDALGLDTEERIATRAEIARWWMVPLTGAVSIGIALFLGSMDRIPRWAPGLPGFAYFGMVLTGFVMTAAARRARRELGATSRAS